MFRSFRVATVFALAAWVAPLHGQDARASFERFSAGLQGLEGRFEQHVFDAGGRLSESSSGQVALRAPRQFRWEYQQPFPQLIVADGDNIWIYDPDLEQVTVRNQSLEEHASPLAVLIDRVELERQFKLSAPASDDGFAWLQLEPRDAAAAQFESARLGFNADDELVRMILDDPLGQRTEVAFVDLRRNPGFDADRFRFTPPPGVDVVGDIVEGAQAYPIE